MTEWFYFGIWSKTCFPKSSILKGKKRHSLYRGSTFLWSRFSMARLSIVIGLEKVAVTEEKRVCLGVEVGRLKRSKERKRERESCAWLEEPFSLWWAQQSLAKFTPIVEFFPLWSEDWKGGTLQAGSHTPACSLYKSQRERESRSHAHSHSYFHWGRLTALGKWSSNRRGTVSHTAVAPSNPPSVFLGFNFAFI